jgi:hypothetical protein
MTPPSLGKGEGISSAGSCSSCGSGFLSESLLTDLKNNREKIRGEDLSLTSKKKDK